MPKMPAPIAAPVMPMALVGTRLVPAFSPAHAAVVLAQRGPTPQQVQMRDPMSGQFAFDGDQDRVCTCGHELGVHVAGGFDCMNNDRVHIYGAAHPKANRFPVTSCDCVKFKPSRKKAP